MEAKLLIGNAVGYMNVLLVVFCNLLDVLEEINVLC